MAIYCGKSKPKDMNEFLIEFVIELNDLQKNGLVIDGVCYGIKSFSFVCDRPARSYIKGIKGHAAYSSRERCSIVGYSYQKTLIFPHSNCSARTDESFR